jgi:hypothetical protein
VGNLRHVPRMLFFPYFGVAKSKRLVSTGQRFMIWNWEKGNTHRIFEIGPLEICPLKDRRRRERI